MILTNEVEVLEIGLMETKFKMRSVKSSKMRDSHLPKQIDAPLLTYNGTRQVQALLNNKNKSMDLYHY